MLVGHPVLHNSLSRCVVSLFLMLTPPAHKNIEKYTHDNSLVTQSIEVSLQKYRWLWVSLWMVMVFPVHGVVPKEAFCLLPCAGIEFLYQTGNRLGWLIGAVWSKAAVTPLHWADKSAGKKDDPFFFYSKFLLH